MKILSILVVSLALFGCQNDDPLVQTDASSFNDTSKSDMSPSEDTSTKIDSSLTPDLGTSDVSEDTSTKDVNDDTPLTNVFCPNLSVSARRQPAALAVPLSLSPI